MQIIKTPTGIIKIDDPAKVISKTEYELLSIEEQHSGEYYIYDAKPTETELIRDIDLNNYFYAVFSDVINAATGKEVEEYDNTSDDYKIKEFICNLIKDVALVAADLSE